LSSPRVKTFVSREKLTGTSVKALRQVPRSQRDKATRNFKKKKGNFSKGRDRGWKGNKKPPIAPMRRRKIEELNHLSKSSTRGKNRGKRSGDGKKEPPHAKLERVIVKIINWRSLNRKAIQAEENR